MEPKQVLEMQSCKKGISSRESDEQQRNWSDEHWLKKASDSLANYDPTRRHLDFEITKGGKIQPIDTSKTIMQKMAESLAARGIRDPNARANVRSPRRTIAQFIFSGSHEKMVKLAFGDQELNPKKGADNSHLVRKNDIENWAKDVYHFVANHFGEDNIISFYVHLDEKSPHIHCSVVPVNNNNKISWKSVFGDGREAESRNMTRLHDELEKEVNEKWGLARGSNMAVTKAKHRSTEEYKRDLVREVNGLEQTAEGLKKQIHRAEIKLKGVSTMITNLLTRKAGIEKEIDLLAKQYGQEGVDTSMLAEKIRELRQEDDRINEKLVRHYQQLEDAKNAILAAQQKLTELERKNLAVRSELGENLDKKAAIVETGVINAYGKLLSESFDSVLTTLPRSSVDVLERSCIFDLIDNAMKVVNCAMLLAVGYVSEATSYVESFGGGDSNMSGWGRDKDDDDERWWLRCVSKASSMVKRAGRGRRR